MIPFEESRSIIRSEHRCLPEETIPLNEALGRCLAQDVYSESDSPRFNNTAVDGYAFRFSSERNEYKVVAEVPAGGRYEAKLNDDECVRIFTGAAIPWEADTAVMQEFTNRSGDLMHHSDEGLKKGSNVRMRGEELIKGELLLSKGSRLNAQSIGLLASCGVEEVSVVRKPTVYVIVTGSEFTTPAINEPGKIYNSNGPMLRAALMSLGIEAQFLQVEDDVSSLRSTMDAAIRESDMVITTGGVSVGDHDHVCEIAEEVGVQTVFHKVAQKPGKPMYFGKTDKAFLFGLPGNPRSVMMGFWIHVLPMLNAMSGMVERELPTAEIPLGEDLVLKGNRTEMLAITLKDGKALISRKQNSHMLSTLVDADGIGIVPSEQRQLEKGQTIKVHLFKS